MAWPRIPLQRAIVLGWLTLVTACETPLPGWDPHARITDGAAPEDSGGEPRLAFDPPALPDAVTRVTRIHVEVARTLGSPRVMLVEGTITSTQLRDLARPAVTQVLTARAQPALVWTSTDSSLVVAPLRVLDAGTLYTVGVSDPPVALSFTVAATDATPLVARMWPDPEEVAVPGTAAVWCGRDQLAAMDAAVTLPPAGVTGQLERGTGATLPALPCVSWFPTAGIAPVSAATPAVTPPSVSISGGAIALLEPALLWPDARIPEPEGAACDPLEVRFGPACATVEDDRVVVRPPAGSVLWTIDGGPTTIVHRSRAARAFVVRPLPADARLRFMALDESGRRVEDVITVRPAPPRAHVVVNEVMANPAGVERTQEWVELFNDGLGPVALAGYGLETGSGTAVLPAGTLAPGAFALVVTEGYVENDGVDPVAAPGTLLVRVPALGRDGLSNEGERLTLRDAAGAALSMFPPMKAKSGVSNARIAPDAPDVNADSFAPSPNGSATPGTPNAAP